ncbi:MAG: NAD(P)/FAD-dependent oxidoreductase [Rubrivivax sp.]|nr:NAD(P)/FAD-dependent oxidoreductase [Rubrivivax sp.]
MPAHRPDGPQAMHEVVILGAGMSGLAMAVGLKAAGRHDFVIVEQSAGLGGTWWDNRYPGAHVDVPAPLYSFSFAPNPHWSRRFASAAEIQAYMQRVAETHGVLAHCRFGRRLVDARFDAGTGRWRLQTDRGDLFVARHFVCSTGPLSVPRWPSIEGLEGFAGARLHSARWDATVPLAGKRVAVIGTGSTASQLLAPVAREAAQVSLFQRTANWVLPRLDRRYGAPDALLARLPPWAAAVRAFWYHVLEWGRRGFDEGSAARRAMQRAALAHLHRQVREPSLRARLTPAYPLGCKRIIYANDYFPAIAQPHVELVTEAIERATPGGLVTADGRERAFDVLVCATGFDVQHSVTLPITGTGGRTLAEAWAAGPEAHLGLAVAGFPNLWLMLGPNTATGHTSTLLFVEPGVRFVLRAMAERERRGVRWLAVREGVMRRFNDELAGRLAGSVWSACRSWYRAPDGRITAIWPGFTREYVRRVQAQGRAEAFARDYEFG